jgi:predicted RNA polymerase sigma factor
MPDLTTHVDFIEDDILQLIFLSCHPQLTAESRAALILPFRGDRSRLSGRGDRDGSADLPGQETLSEAHIDFALPVGTERTDRLDDVMAVVFNEGYTATAGDHWMRPELTNEAIRLARMLAELMPDEPEAHGLQALLELQASRACAASTPRADRCCSMTRTGACGTNS